MHTDLVEMLVRLWEQQREEQASCHVRVVASAAGFSIAVTTESGERRQSALPWHGISKVLAFKGCRGPKPVTCVAVLDRQSRVMLLDATMAGWSDFITTLQQVIPNAVPFEQWYPSLRAPSPSRDWAKIYETNL